MLERNPPTQLPKKSILIVDDHPMVRDGLGALIDEQPDMRVCAHCATMAEAMAAIRRSRPDLAIVDISLQDSHGIDLVRRIRAHDDSIRIMVFSMYDPSLYADVAFQTGATSYLHKQEPNMPTLKAIRLTLDGRRFCSNSDLETGRGSKPPAAATRTALSTRELQVFHLLGEGRSTREIAGLLNLSQHTIDTHRENIKGKLGLRTGNELVRAAVQWVRLGSRTAS